MSKFTPKDITASRGFISQITTTVRLILRLMADSRVSPLLKILPVGGLIYWISPIDLMPGLPFDDAAVVLGAVYLFIELCPPEIVAEHRAAIQRVVSGSWRDPDEKKDEREDVVDGEFRDVTSSTEQPREREKEQR